MCRQLSRAGATPGRLMPRTKQRTPELKERLVSAALGLLAEEGAAGLTARSLAARAETSAPALYELFGDKSGVVRELYFEPFEEDGAALSTYLQLVGQTARTKIPARVQ